MIITLEQVKQFTTLTDADDATITAMIPVIDSKVKLITGNRYNWQIVANLKNGSDFAEVYKATNYAGIDIVYGNSGINAPWQVDDIDEFLEVGAQLSGQGIADGTYITEVYSNGQSDNSRLIPHIKLSSAATATVMGPVYVGIPLGYVPTIAKGVQWLIEQTTKGSESAQRGIASKRMGPVSVTYGGKDAEIDGASGMPGWFVKALPHYHGGH